MSLLTDNPASYSKLPGNKWFYWICTWIWSNTLEKGYLALVCEPAKCAGNAFPFPGGKANDVLSVYWYSLCAELLDIMFLYRKHSLGLCI